MKSLLRLKPYLLRHKKILILGILTVVGSNLFSVVQPLLLGYAVDELKAGIETSTYITDNLMMWALYIVGFSLVAGFFTYLTRQTLIVTSRHIEYDLRNDFLAHLQKLHYPYFQNTPTGDLMAHATNDIAAVRNVLGPGIMYPSDTLMTFTMVLTMMLVTDWRLTLLALVPLPLVSLVVYRISKSVHEKFNERQEQFSKLTTKAQENLSGIRVIKAYVRELFEIEDFRTISWDYLKKNLVLARVQSIMWPLMFVLVGFSILMVLYFGGVRVIDGAITIGTLTAFFGYLVMLIWPMIAFGWVANLMQQGAASMARLAKIFDTVPEIRDTEATDQSITNIRGEIEFRNVTFTHKNAEKPTLKNINLKIDNGMTLAVIGYTGAGKTTLINLITRLYEASEGEVLVDGAPVRNIPVAILRSHIGYVPQETFLFSDTIAENIRYGVDNHHSEEHLRDAAEIAQISKDVIEFPKQFETMIGERGITLSGGQKQRTSIARALMREPNILILDDALSSVDTHTEEEILKRLREFMRNRTSIIISHRISTVKDADLICVLDNGEIVERGTHDELVALGGIYAHLHEKQLLEQELDAI
ncbi:MAG: ABC transporter ATP-binding protein/permease [Ignavibacteriae bacterium]|nr:ABC transporter ATP-binding protein/permease [Ignavibacteriota bacterium]